MQDFTNQTSSGEYAVNDVTTQESVINTVVRDVFMWMFGALLLTAIVAYFTISSGLYLRILINPTAFYILLGVELLLVFLFSAKVQSFSSTVSTAIFGLYSILNGVTIACIIARYAQGTVYQAFFLTAGLFGVMAVYGYTTKRSLANWGSCLFMGLIGVIIAMVVNFFVGGGFMGLVISGVCVILFSGLTAFEVNRLKEYAGQMDVSDREEQKRLAIGGALSLYLNFINLFLHILRLLNRR